MPALSVTIPVFNKEVRPARSLPRRHEFLSRHIGASWEIVVANNGSTDRTQAVAERFARDLVRVRVLWRPQKGRGGALKQAWLESAAAILSYMDVDLSTDLGPFPALVDAIATQAYDLAVGSRRMRDARTEQSCRREFVSRAYLGLVRELCGLRLSDVQCGFKAITREAADQLLPLVEDTGWFLDIELLVLAQRRGFRIAEVPVRWIEDSDSRVRLLRTAWGDLRGLLRLRRTLGRGGHFEEGP